MKYVLATIILVTAVFLLAASFFGAGLVLLRSLLSADWSVSWLLFNSAAVGVLFAVPAAIQLFAFYSEEWLKEHR